MKTAPSSVRTASLTFLHCSLFNLTGSATDSTPPSSHKDPSQPKTPRVSLHITHVHKKQNNKTKKCVYEWFCLVHAELPSASEGDVRDVSEDGLSSGEAGGQSARVPQLLFPLLALQHQTQVRTTTQGFLKTIQTIDNNFIEPAKLEKVQHS